MHILQVVIFVLLTVSSVFGQSFTLNDTVISKGDVLVSYRLNFEFNNSTIKPESFEFLDSVAAFLLKRDSLTIEVSNHCDERWSDRYSTCLTCVRARATADYLIQKGVRAERIVAKGYNDKKPIIRNAKTETEHRRNRRTEFRVLGCDYRIR
jgi:outer membrane protein OmpA-like peptidoglycan-associated protein